MVLKKTMYTKKPTPFSRMHVKGESTWAPAWLGSSGESKDRRTKAAQTVKRQRAGAILKKDAGGEVLPGLLIQRGGKEPVVGEGVAHERRCCPQREAWAG